MAFEVSTEKKKANHLWKKNFQKITYYSKQILFMGLF